MALLVMAYLELAAMLSARLASGTLYLSFFSNNATPGLNSVVGDFTECLDGVSGLPIRFTLPAGSWTITETANGAQAVQPVISTIVNGPFTTYGYFVWDGSTVYKYGQLWAGGPIVFASGPQALIFTPVCNANSPS